MARGGLSIDDPEVALAKAVARFLDFALRPLGIPYTHFPAGEKREKVTRIRKGRTVTFSPAGARLKAMGLKPGWPDYQLIMPNGQAAFIELKVGDNGLSDDQIAVRASLIECGCGYAVCRSLDEVDATLSRWLAKFGLVHRATITAGGTVRITRPDAPIFEGVS